MRVAGRVSIRPDAEVPVAGQPGQARQVHVHDFIPVEDQKVVAHAVHLRKLHADTDCSPVGRQGLCQRLSEGQKGERAQVQDYNHEALEADVCDATLLPAQQAEKQDAGKHDGQ